MYIITFYSFKGGVGRTMGLVNVALELAKEGRRVLAVDFDLEAPGLDTYPIMLRPGGGKTMGMVDFVTEYCKTGTSPKVSGFVYDAAPEAVGPDRVFVMPTGAPDEGYGARLSSIDWQGLYAERDGYLLFEDLKEQWKSQLRPDYVLIDSRTGHTDVGGICTRQLPDAVALFFFPNEQNLRGLEGVANEIRDEPSRAANPPQLYFVASNVPDLDDEDHILRERLRLSRSRLGYEDLAGTIHHYDSLALLDQSVFVVEREGSKLAREYRKLTQGLIGRNLDDRRVALKLLNDLATGAVFRGRVNVRKLTSDLEDLESRYRDDGEVVYQLASANRTLGREEAADRLVSKAQQLGIETSETLTAAAKQAYENSELDAARALIRQAIEKPPERPFGRQRVFEIVSKRDPGYLTELAPLVANTLDPEEIPNLVERLMTDARGAGAAEALLKRALADNALQADLRQTLVNQLSLCLIALGSFSEARTVLTASEQMHLAETFNLAMSVWGETGQVPVEMFARVVETYGAKPQQAGNANRSQCFAIANWAVGDIDRAVHFLDVAEALIRSEGEAFSAWRYLHVGAEAFLDDLNEMRQFVESGLGAPAIYRSGES
jgi:cellulose biosynthesis protein BcsQ